MKSLGLITLFALGCLASIGGVSAAPTPPVSPIAADLNAIDARVNAKEKAGQEQPADFAEEFAAYDALLAKAVSQKAGEAAEVALARAMLHWDLGSPADVVAQNLRAVTTSYPGTKSAATAARILKNNATLAGLVGQPAPELHFTWSSTGKLTTLSALRGKVVVIDFWATWCGPCLRAFPEVRENVARFKDSPVVFLGVTSLQGRVSNLEPKRIDTKGQPELERSLMPRFMAAKNMTWPVAFSAEDVFNPDYGVSGIPYVAIITPDGMVRHAGINPGDPHADIGGKIEAILREYHLATPTPKP